MWLTTGCSLIRKQATEPDLRQPSRHTDLPKKGVQRSVPYDPIREHQPLPPLLWRRLPCLISRQPIPIARVRNRPHMQGIANMAGNEKTSPSVASKAAKLLRSPTSSKAVKSVSGSALTQAPNRPNSKKSK